MTVQSPTVPQVGQLVSYTTWAKSISGIHKVLSVTRHGQYYRCESLRIMDSKGKIFKNPKVPCTFDFDPNRHKIVDDKFIDDMFQRDVEAARLKAQHLSSNMGL